VVGLTVRSIELPSSVMIALTNALRTFFESVDKSDSIVSDTVPITIEQDSQDYGDDTFLEDFLEEFVPAQDKPSFPIGIIIDSINSHLYKLISNLFVSSNSRSETIAKIIDIWILGLAILARHQQRDWNLFLQYGGEWERLRSINSKESRTWSAYILSQVLSLDSNAYFQGQDHFIAAWFESIVEPDLTSQHSYTELLLNISNGNTLITDSFFVKEGGKYKISSDELFEARPALIVCMFSPNSLT
jgi:hypothetical protein